MKQEQKKHYSRGKGKNGGISQWSISIITGIPRWKLSAANCGYVELSIEEKELIERAKKFGKI